MNLFPKFMVLEPLPTISNAFSFFFQKEPQRDIVGIPSHSHNTPYNALTIKDVYTTKLRLINIPLLRNLDQNVLTITIWDTLKTNAINWLVILQINSRNKLLLSLIMLMNLLIVKPIIKIPTSLLANVNNLFLF